MPSPFPGMAPYLESPALWPDVHHSLIFCIRNLVEIDLLRRGAHLLAVPELLLERLRPFDYLVCVHRAVRYGTYQLYARTLRPHLPRIGIPLRPKDGNVVLDLQAVLQRCYDSAPYARLINYGAEPSTPLSPADTARADTLLRAQGLRER